jgi:hypothetical protein
LDAEMVMDRLQKPDRTFEEIPRLLIYDIVTWQVLYSLLSRIWPQTTIIDCTLGS